MRNASGFALMELMVTSLLFAALIQEVGTLQGSFGRFQTVLKDRVIALVDAKVARIFLVDDWTDIGSLTVTSTTATVKGKGETISYQLTSAQLVRTSVKAPASSQVIGKRAPYYKSGTGNSSGGRFYLEWSHGKNVTRLQTFVQPIP